MISVLTQKQKGSLIALGLSPLQLDLYLTSLKHGILSVLELSKHTGVNRQQIYHDAEKLVEMGLYGITRKNRRKYIAANPNKLISIGRKNIEDTENILSEINHIIPTLESIPSAKKSEITIRHYEGIKKIEEAYKEELASVSGDEILSFAGSIDNIFEFFPEKYWDKWNKQLVKQRSKSRMIVHNSEIARETAKLDNLYNRKTHWIEHLPLKTNVDVFNSTVLIVSFYDETAIWIDSRTISESYRILFNTLWSLSKPFN